MNRNRILGLLMTGALSVGMLASSASAATINMENNGADGAKYSAYQLMSLTTSLKAGHEDHEGAHEHDCYNYAYTVNAAYRDILKEVAGIGADVTGEKAIDAAILSYIGGLQNTASDAGAVQDFASAVYRKILAAGLSADKGEVAESFTDAAQGYYLIVESTTGDDPDSRSLVMLDTAGQENITVTSKEDVPQFEKKIVVGENRQDSDLVAVGDTVHYELKITPPKASVMAQYDTYKYIVHDDISEGLQLVAGSVKCYVGGVEVTPDSIVTTGFDDNCELEVLFNNVKGIVGDGQVMLVQYDCTVVVDAVPGAPGNPNTAHLEFSNNPYDNGNGTSHTPDDKVAAFTFQLQVNKVDKDGQALSGAEFQLLKKNAAGEYEVLVEKMDPVGGDATQFLMKGLDVGDYKLIETTVPDGYQRCDDVEFTIAANAETDSANPQLLELVVKRGDKIISQGEDAEFSATTADGKVMTKIINVTGNRLPSTGGMGVYALYIGGAVLVFGGVGLGMAAKNKKKETEN